MQHLCSTRATNLRKNGNFSGENMSNQGFRFTDKAVRDIKPTAKREYYHDTIEKDLLLQVTPSGVKTFYLYKRMGDKPI